MTGRPRLPNIAWKGPLSGDGLPGIRHIAALAAIALTSAPLVARASSPGTFGYIVTLGGNQTQPSIDGQYVVYSGPAVSPVDGTDVFVYDLLAGSIGVVAFGPGDQDSPDTYGTLVAYRTPDGIGIRNWLFDLDLRLPDRVRDAGGTGHPTIGSDVAAWELGGPERDIVVARLYDGRELGLGPDGAIPVPGDQHSPAARGPFVAYVDEADSAAAWLFDSRTAGSATRIGPKLVSASGVALCEHQGQLFAAVAHSEPGVHDADVEVWDGAGSGVPGMIEIAALHVPGVQRNPHISSDWVAFEDVSTGHSQVVLWRWVEGPGGVVFVPHPSAGEQILNDLHVADGTHVRVVFADDANGDFDLALYDLAVSADAPNGGAGTDWPPRTVPPTPGAASCDDIAAATVLAKLNLVRNGQKPAAFTETFQVPATASGIMPLLVCMEADGVSAGWVTVDDRAIARPSDFDPSVTRREIPCAVTGSTAEISGVIAGKPGATLTAYVLADPARAGASTSAGAVQGRLPAVAARAGCGSGGAVSPGSLAGLLALALLARRRRA